MNKQQIISQLSHRWSPVAFSEKQILTDELALLFQAAALAPSSYNEQPWRFLYSRRGDDDFSAFVGFLAEANKVWAQHASVLAVSVAAKTFSRNAKENRFAFHDTGMAVGNLLAQATEMGISVHQMGGYSIEAVRSHFSLPQEVEPVAMMALGYHGQGENLPDEVRNREKERSGRKPLSHFVFKGAWEKPAFD